MEKLGSENWEKANAGKSKSHVRSTLSLFLDLFCLVVVSGFGVPLDPG